MVIPGVSSAAIFDQPTHRPSDTWFGPTTMTGELCYAIRTSVRLNLENLPARPGRAISVVQVKNQSRTDLKVEKPRVPSDRVGTPHLRSRGMVS
jgi:hypothetical protein